MLNLNTGSHSSNLICVMSQIGCDCCIFIYNGYSVIQQGRVKYLIDSVFKIMCLIFFDNKFEYLLSNRYVFASD